MFRNGSEVVLRRKKLVCEDSTLGGGGMNSELGQQMGCCTSHDSSLYLRTYLPTLGA